MVTSDSKVSFMNKKQIKKKRPQKKSTQKKKKHTKKKQISTANKIKIGISAIVSIITVIVMILIFVVSKSIDDSRAAPHRFKLESNVIRTWEKIIVIADNKKSNKCDYLDVKFDGYLFKKAGEPLPRTGISMQKWEFNLDRHGTKKVQKPGEYWICFAFEGKGFSSEQKITIIEDSGGSFFLILIGLVIILIVVAFIVFRNIKSKKA